MPPRQPGVKVMCAVTIRMPLSWTEPRVLATPPTEPKESSSELTAHRPLKVHRGGDEGRWMRVLPSAPTSYSFVVPAHNEAEIVAASIDSMRSWLSTYPNSEIVIVENGSTDDTLAVARAAAALDGVPVRVLTSAKGLGAALRTGVLAATGDVVITTAADLPFGRSDLDQFIASKGARFAVGSKAHPESLVPRPLGRTAMTMMFRVARFIVLRVSTADTQGTQLIERKLAQELARQCRDTGFGFSTEMVYLAARRGVPVVELPVRLSETHQRPSSVRPLHDGVRMIRSLFEIRRRHRPTQDSWPAPATAGIAP